MTKTVCIVGAGPSGLVAAKTLLHNAAAPDLFSVTIYDPQSRIGGLWPLRASEAGGIVHPLMVANQSRHTVQFSDFAWQDDVPHLPRAWMIGRYLEGYAKRYLDGRADLRLGWRVVRAERADGGQGWDVRVKKEGDGEEESRRFDCLLVASGFFGAPRIDENLAKNSNVPVIHSSAYRDLHSLFGDSSAPRPGKIIVAGGQMSGIEIAGTIASHISSARHSPSPSPVAAPEGLTVHHLIQRPIWVFPLYTSPIASSKRPPFLPLDFTSYNLSNREKPLADTQGYISEEAAKNSHVVFQFVLGTDQSEFSSALASTEAERTDPLYLAISDYYCDFVRSGLISVERGKLQSVRGTTAETSSGQDPIHDVAAIILATGFDPSKCVEFLPTDILDQLHYSPEHIDIPLALDFHGACSSSVPGLGFVGFYRSPYWAIMEMQARLLTALWTPEDLYPGSERLRSALSANGCRERALSLRDNPRCSQFPMGDFPFITNDFAAALGLEISESLASALPILPHNNKPLDFLNSSRYLSPKPTADAVAENRKSLQQAHSTMLEGLTSPGFVARAVFRSLLGTWKLERDLTSRLDTHPSGHFSGTARFLLRAQTQDGMQCVRDPSQLEGEDDADALEYLYVEEGEFRADNGLVFQATRRYVWRYDEGKDVLSVWFVKPEDQKRADYLFHEIKFLDAEAGSETGWLAEAGHLCIDDFYNVKYEFNFRAVNLQRWTIGYKVNGPAKDYSISGIYTR